LHERVTLEYISLPNHFSVEPILTTTDSSTFEKAPLLRDILKDKYFKVLDGTVIEGLASDHVENFYEKTKA